MESRAAEIADAVEAAFATEVASFDGPDRPFIEGRVGHFLQVLDRSFNRWRIEYAPLNEELREVNRKMAREGHDPNLDRRRAVIEIKLEKMRRGQGDWYVYRYLGGEGFLPNYAFPRRATVLSFGHSEDELARAPVIALSEYAPGNFVYCTGDRYEVTHARPRTRGMALDIQHLLMCRECRAA